MDDNIRYSSLCLEDMVEIFFDVVETKLDDGDERMVNSTDATPRLERK